VTSDVGLARDVDLAGHAGMALTELSLRACGLADVSSSRLIPRMRRAHRRSTRPSGRQSTRPPRRAGPITTAASRDARPLRSPSRQRRCDGSRVLGGLTPAGRRGFVVVGVPVAGRSATSDTVDPRPATSIVRCTRATGSPARPGVLDAGRGAASMVRRRSKGVGDRSNRPDCSLERSRTSSKILSRWVPACYPPRSRRLLRRAASAVVSWVHAERCFGL